MNLLLWRLRRENLSACSSTVAGALVSRREEGAGGVQQSGGRAGGAPL